MHEFSNETHGARTNFTYNRNILLTNCIISACCGKWKQDVAGNKGFKGNNQNNKYCRTKRNNLKVIKVLYLGKSDVNT